MFVFFHDMLLAVPGLEVEYTQAIKNQFVNNRSSTMPISQATRPFIPTISFEMNDRRRRT